MNHEELYRYLKDNALEYMSRQMTRHAASLNFIKKTLNGAFLFQNNQLQIRDFFYGISVPENGCAPEDVEIYNDRIKENLGFEIIFRLENFIISNSCGHTHRIKNLFCKLFFDTELKFGKEILGVRTTLSLAELNSTYIHSHFPTIDEEAECLEFQPLCIGTSPLNDFISKLSEGFDPQNFEMFIYMLKECLQWESLEGAPYLSIADIYPLKYKPVLPGSFKGDMIDINDRISRYLRKAEPNFLLNLFEICYKGEFRIELNSAFDALVKEILNDLECQDGLLVYKFSNGEYGHIDYVEAEDDDSDLGYAGNCILASIKRYPILKYYGKELYLNVDHEEEIQNSEVYPHPDIIQSFKATLESKLKTSYSNRARKNAEDKYSPFE